MRYIVVGLIVAGLAACGDTNNYYFPPPPEDGAVVDASPPDANVDATVDATVDAAPEPTTLLGQPCEPFIAFSCAAPFVCGQDSRVCTISCNVSNIEGDHEWCQFLTDQAMPEQIGVCSTLSDFEGRCYVGCNDSSECPAGTFCTGQVRPGGAARAFYCRR